MNNKNDTTCTECKATVSASEDVQVGEVIACPECSADLEVVATKPLKVSLAPKVQEDWGQ